MTAFTDRWGVPVQAESAKAVALLDQAVEDLAALAGEPVAGTRAALAEDDRLLLGHIYSAYLSLYANTSAGVAAARKVLDDLERFDGGTDEREVLHLRAARAWANGEWGEATRSLERALLHNPRDLLALKVAQDLYFFLGNRLDLRDVAARVLPAWPVDLPGWGYISGIYAFGLEENADYRAAEARARDALIDNPLDVWAVHALAHVFEMEGRQHEGVAFLTETAPDWSPSYFAVHNWWHRCLYHLDLLEFDEVLDLYDGPIRAERSAQWLDIVDAAALLWRLSLFGVDVNERAERLADDVEALLDGPVYVFNDWHAAMALALVGRQSEIEQLVASTRRHAVGTNRLAAERAGLTLLEGFASFADGHFDRALDLLVDIRPCAHAVGGSHAQRDIIDLTLLATAARAGQEALAQALLAERVARKPTGEQAAAALLRANGL